MVIRRENQLKVMISDEESAMLKQLADVRGVSMADLVRGLIRGAHEAAQGEVARRVAKRFRNKQRK